MLLAGQPVHQRFVRPGPLVLGTTLLKFPTPTADRDRTVSRRSEPRSRTALMGEQPNPWDLLQPQDATIRHRACRPPLLVAQTISSSSPDCPEEEPASDEIRLICRELALPAAIPSHQSRNKVRELDQSLRGQDLAVRLPTVLSSARVLKLAGVHRYKPILFGDGISAVSPLMLRCQTSPSMWTLGGDKPVIPRVAFIR